MCLCRTARQSDARTVGRRNGYTIRCHPSLTPWIISDNSRIFPGISFLPMFSSILAAWGSGVLEATADSAQQRIEPELSSVQPQQQSAVAGSPDSNARQSISRLGPQADGRTAGDRGGGEMYLFSASHIACRYVTIRRCAAVRCHRSRIGAGPDHGPVVMPQ